MVQNAYKIVHNLFAVCQIFFGKFLMFHLFQTLAAYVHTKPLFPENIPCLGPLPNQRDKSPYKTSK